ncbi:hypothetical protein KUCAC02_014123 [Chaenocephalus aceratus]|uniref:Uncharacterized protein n=1 Tax=Chaenocephalus aceratus TaxID=36190 RepID=A0ACB9WCX7_CHAAC|nr:hypothetical protein KUCAC02_014123 [Chaenocephalus aceratus]
MSRDSAGRRRFQHLACCWGFSVSFCWVGIIGVCVYLAPLIHESDSNRFKEVSNSTGEQHKTQLRKCKLDEEHPESEGPVGQPDRSL